MAYISSKATKYIYRKVWQTASLPGSHKVGNRYLHQSLWLNRATQSLHSYGFGTYKMLILCYQSQMLWFYLLWSLSMVMASKEEIILVGVMHQCSGTISDKFSQEKISANCQRSAKFVKISKTCCMVCTNEALVGEFLLTVCHT